MSVASHLSVSRWIHGGSFSSDACSAPSHVRPISIFVPWIVSWPKEVAAVGARGVGVGTARKHASTQAHSVYCAGQRQRYTRPAHIATCMCPLQTCTQIHLRGVWPNVTTQQRPALSGFHRPTTRGRYTGVVGSIHGHWPAPKTSRKPTPACMYKHGTLAWVRWPCVPIEAVWGYIPGIE